MCITECVVRKYVQVIKMLMQVIPCLVDTGADFSVTHLDAVYTTGVGNPP